MAATWGNILVIGGAGRLGYFVVRELLKQQECSRIVSFNRRLHPENQLDGVDYRAIDLRASQTLSTLMHEIKPEIIINTAAPGHINDATPEKEFQEVLVDAQAHLLELARTVGTRVWISACSANVAGGWEHKHIDESAPYWPEDAKPFEYWMQKAEAERQLLAADSPTLQTVSVRLTLIIGERDYAFVPSILDLLEQKQTGVQLGSDNGKLSQISAEDAARAHILALRKLLQPDNNVHGEVFFISNTRALGFWTMAQLIWGYAGWQKKKEPLVIPESVALGGARLSEWFTYLTSFGKKSPVFGQRAVYFMCREWTYDCTKAEKRLGFVPKNDVEEQLKKSVEWELQRRKNKK